MHRYKYLLVGGGIAADAAARAIREVDPDAAIGLIGDEPHPPYDRPPLSKDLWAGMAEEAVWRGTGEQGVALHLGRRAVRLDAATRRLLDDRGTEFGYQNLLLATGGTPRRLAGDAAGEVIHFRTLDDYRRLRAAVERGGRFAVVGGGWIGPEIAAALRAQGCEVTLVFPEPAIGARTLPPSLARRITDEYRAAGITVRTGVAVTGVERRDGRLAVLAEGGAIVVDTVVAGLGIEPNTGVARTAGLDVRGGIVVDGTLATDAPGVFAAGDIARFHDPVLDRWGRVEHEDAANAMGTHAGRGMAGEPDRYRQLPYFYSDLLGFSIEAVGDLDPRVDALLEDWIDPYERGACFFVRDGVVRGVLLCNLRGRRRRALRLVERRTPAEPEELRGLLTS
jgi:3-phenylpropionate/trans-cinnamate dioxygenase ferredoxin reductase component